MVWTELNKDWIEKQEAKAAAAALLAATGADITDQAEVPADATATADGEAAAAGLGLGAEPTAATATGEDATAKPKKPGPKKGSKHKKAIIWPEADSAQDAAFAMLESKKLSGKINYNVLEELFAGPSEDAAGKQGAGALFFFLYWYTWSLLLVVMPVNPSISHTTARYLTCSKLV